MGIKFKIKLNDFELFRKRVDESLANVKFTFFKSSGPGGQHRNKVETAARATDSITGFSAESTDSKSQKVNKSSAWAKLTTRIIEHYRLMDASEGLIQVPTDVRIRTYNEKRNEVVDHRTGVRVPYDSALDGAIEPFITGVKK